MKKIIFMLAMLLLPLSILAAYQSMLIKDTAGKEYLITANGLNITFADGTLTAVNGENTVSLALADVASMQFSGATTAISEIDLSGSSFTAYTASGANAGTFSSLEDAKAALSAGTYIIKYNNGPTAKILIRK